MKLIIKKNIVAGLGEIGSPICILLEKKSLVVGYDLNKKLLPLYTLIGLTNADWISSIDNVSDTNQSFRLLKISF